MNTKIITLLFFVVIIQFNNSVSAQDAYQFGGLPSLNLNVELKNDWSLNTKIESRQLFQTRELNGNVDKNYDYVLTDFSLVAAKRVGLNSRIAGGYLIRFEDGELFHRFIQQYIIVQKLSGFRLAHRFLSDQTFSEIEKPEFRMRYRITTEIPLNGLSVDQGEFYVKINNEYVNSLQANAYDLEIRLVPLLGYDMADNFKIETGLDYRVDSFLNNKTRHSYWMVLNFFIEM
ncbi:MAG: hypothetical protein B7Z06_06915 [Flavobacteriales bacterium 32-35-8]|nr:MAG: hypothetical protein B7Z06_06915 [Flavobacteriales bacterium 32-35-8]